MDSGQVVIGMMTQEDMANLSLRVLKSTQAKSEALLCQLISDKELPDKIKDGIADAIQEIASVLLTSWVNIKNPTPEEADTWNAYAKKFCTAMSAYRDLPPMEVMGPIRALVALIDGETPAVVKVLASARSEPAPRDHIASPEIVKSLLAVAARYDSIGAWEVAKEQDKP